MLRVKNQSNADTRCRIRDGGVPQTAVLTARHQNLAVSDRHGLAVFQATKLLRTPALP